MKPKHFFNAETLAVAAEAFSDIANILPEGPARNLYADKVAFCLSLAAMCRAGWMPKDLTALPEENDLFDAPL